MPQTDKIILPRGTKVPDHLGLIPDGNRRWARARGLHTLLGHKAGFDRAVELSRAAREIGIHTVTLWGFSTENWDRSKQEISYLMKLYGKLIDDYLAEANRDGVKLIHLGRKDRLPKFLLQKISDAEAETKANTNYIMNIAIDYGGQDDIIRATQNMIKDGVRPEAVDKALFEKYLDTHTQPYPYVDLMIRTSGEQRTSGFLLWQGAYAETFWDDGHFPDFSPEKLKGAILDYSRRRRRFGGNDAMEHFSFKPEVVAKLELAWWRLKKIPAGTRLRDYAWEHLRAQYGMSKAIAKEAAGYMLAGKGLGKWKKFYKLIKDELKLAFEPKIVASLEVKLQKEISGLDTIKAASDAENTAQNLYAEVYGFSLLQAAKLAHLRVLAGIERNLAERGLGEEHWIRAEDYLQKFYRALKERVA